MEVNIVTHDFLEQLYSLLSDPDLMKDENLLFTDGNSFQAPSKDKPADYILRDINDGSVYLDAFLHYTKVTGTVILVPIILYIDKTHVDQQGCLFLEPVSFTLGIFKKEIRILSFAW